MTLSFTLTLKPSLLFCVDAHEAFAKLNDQELVSDMYMAGRYNITLDHQSQIFQSVHSTDPPLPYCHPEEHLVDRQGYWYGNT